MTSPKFMLVCTVVLAVVLAGCQDLEPLKKDIADLQGRVARLQSDVVAAKQAAEQAQGAAQGANENAKVGQVTANQALAAAQASQQMINSLNEKVERMFRRALSK